MKISFKTIGCRLNQAETEDLKQEFLDAGYSVASPKQASDVFIINTCSVTHVAARKSRQTLREYKNRNKKSRIVVIGCAAQDLEKLPEVDLVIFNEAKENAFERISDFIGQSVGTTLGLSGDNSRAAQGSPLQVRVRKLIKIQDGCDEFCTYCIVPYLRGKPKSISADKIISKIKKYEVGTEHGSVPAKEIILTGVHIGQYKNGLANLLNRIITETKIPRIRLSSIEPQHFSDDVLVLFKNPRICNFLHLPIQSGTDKILKAMQRKYNITEVENLVGKIHKKSSNIFLSTDIIVGFPGESEADFKQTYDFCKNSNFAKIHVFSYSMREGTKAAQMPDQLDPQIIKARSEKLRKLSDKLQAEYLAKFINKEVEILPETTNSGVTNEGIKVNWDKKREINKFFSAKIISADNNRVKLK